MFFFMVMFDFLFKINEIKFAQKTEKFLLLQQKIKSKFFGAAKSQS